MRMGSVVDSAAPAREAEEDAVEEDMVGVDPAVVVDVVDMEAVDAVVRQAGMTVVVHQEDTEGAAEAGLAGSAGARAVEAAAAVTASRVKVRSSISFHDI